MKFKTFLFLILFVSGFIFSEEIRYKADEMKVSFDEKGEIEKIFLGGNVIISYKDIVIKTQKSVFDRKKNEIECSEKVEIFTDIGSFYADFIRYNLIEEKGIIYNAEFKIEPFYGKAENIQRDGNVLKIENGYITTCELENPHYRISAEKIEFVKDNYLRGEKMKITFGKNFNVLYFPRYTIDMKTKRPFFTPSIGYKTTLGQNIGITFTHRVAKEKDYLMSEKIMIETKGTGFGIGGNSEKNNFTLDSFLYKKWDEDKLKPGFFLNINRNFRNRHFLMDWRWMHDNDFFIDFFKDEFLRKSKMYNYISLTQQIESGILGINIRENAEEEILKIEKIPEIRYLLPVKKISDFPVFLSEDFRITNFYKEGENYLRILNQLDFTGKKEFKFFTLKPYFSFLISNYQSSEFDKTNFIGETGINLSSLLSQNLKETKIYFTPSISLFSRRVKYKPHQLIKLDEIEEKNNGKFVSLNLSWAVRNETEIVGNFEIENEYDIDRSKNGELFLKYEFGSNRLKFEGQNEWDNMNYEFGINSVSFEKEKYKISFGTRYEKESDIFGIETWYEQNLRDDLKYRIGFFYDFNSDGLTQQTYEIWKKIHCLTLDFRITKDKENFNFYFFIIPSAFFEERWERRFSKWK